MKSATNTGFDVHAALTGRHVTKPNRYQQFYEKKSDLFI